jgi:hypothetical protein
MGMPYAFAQFTVSRLLLFNAPSHVADISSRLQTNEEAQEALTKGRGITIFGRPCRTEMVRANRTFILYGREDEDITLEEAREICSRYGTLARCEELPAQIRETMGLPYTVLVEFRIFDARRDFNAVRFFFPRSLANLS